MQYELERYRILHILNIRSRQATGPLKTGFRDH